MAEKVGLVVIKTEWLTGAQKPTVAVLKQPLVNGRLTELDLDIDWRTVSRITLTLVRRPLSDVDGAVKDAEKLANEEDVKPS